MPSRSPLDALLAIRENASLAREWMENTSPEALTADRRLLYAVTRCLEIVSEASRRLPQPMRERHAHLPWRAIMDVGNVYRHEYDTVSVELVWRTVRERLAPLLAMAEAEIATLTATPS